MIEKAVILLNEGIWATAWFASVRSGEPRWFALIFAAALAGAWFAWWEVA